MDGTQTLEQLDGKDWGEPTYDSYLVATVHRLRRKLIAEFTVEDLRLMLGQNVGVEHLVPSALDHLEQDPFISGDFYPGDLLGVVLSINPGYWRAHPNDAVRIGAISERAALLLRGRDEIDSIKAHLWQLMAARPWSAT